MVLADTSVWVDYLRRGTEGRARALDDLLQRGEAIVCGPVAAELIAGVPAPRRSELWTLLAGLPWADLQRSIWFEVGEVAGELRSRGTSVPLTDIEIAVSAVHAHADIWTNDSDFKIIAGVVKPLRFYSPPGA